ncbi:ABC transporter [Mangrovactinospora gilvigrisea]|uniref:ABC transporter n=2 Tax=Mangrovactinospora gilvigrisea TaxID=1428644 RepID=A0A1J7CEF8_9ACTN|nr:ABC transporter [Mangrovactinospora gilvigrisea]
MDFRAPVRPPGLRAALASVVRPRYRTVRAVRGLEFALRPGEVAGFLGPNGAGKTTTMKMLAGILHPTAGTARVLGRVPWRRERSLLRRIALVRGSRPLGGPEELTVLDTLRFQRLLYEVPDAEFRRNLAELGELLELAELMGRQVRALSLGERMRAGLAAALVHRPRVLFLDEPTIGLDVAAAAAVRAFLAGYAERTAATVLLTSHHMPDVEALCRRVLLIERGRVRYDGALDRLAAELAPHQLVRVTPAVAGATAEWERFGTVQERGEGGRVALRVPRAEVPRVVGELLARLPVAELAVEEPPLEAVLARFHQEDAE